MTIFPACLVAVFFLCRAVFAGDQVANCEKYDSDHPTKCKRCLKGFYLLDNKCDPCSIDKCIECDDKATCSLCSDGFYANTTECLKCELQCELCSSKYSCSKCSKDYFLAVRSCVTKKVSALFYAGLVLLGLSLLFMVGCLWKCLLALRSEREVLTYNLFQSEVD